MERSFLGIRKCVQLPEVVLDVLRILIKAKDVRERNVIDDFGRCQPIHLLLKNVAQAFFGVRELLLHLLALIQPLDDFRDIKARFHIEVNYVFFIA